MLDYEITGPFKKDRKLMETMRENGNVMLNLTGFSYTAFIKKIIVSSFTAPALIPICIEA